MSATAIHHDRSSSSTEHPWNVQGSPPVRTLEQRMAALDRANQVRLGRAALKQDIAAGDVNPADLLESPPAFIATMKVYDLLCALPRWGDVKVLSVLSGCGVSPAKRVAGLTKRQRDSLAARVRGHLGGEPVPTTPSWRGDYLTVEWDGRL